MTARPEVLLDAETIRRRVEALGALIGEAYVGREIAVVGLMKSCLVFMADLIRVLPVDVTCHTLRVASSREPGVGEHAEITDIVYSAEIPWEGRHVLLLDDIIDTGITLRFLLDHIKDRNPASLRVCTLIDKPKERKIDVKPDWAAFTIEEPGAGFLVGYGLDFGEHYRGLPYIGTIPRPVPQAPAGA
ncbi:MAG: hypoxanthine phosphoribosyltransferase [Vicinamibacteria bacterium]|jgi:hypoxanthine phosphoribosyltransferase|nr:hypoxanthine phosphoribosyltransferase [Vicinamibacteria bacterium]